MRPRGHWETSRLYGQKGLTIGGRRGDRGRGSVRRKRRGVKTGRENLMVEKGIDFRVWAREKKEEGNVRRSDE